MCELSQMPSSILSFCESHGEKDNSGVVISVCTTQINSVFYRWIETRILQHDIVAHGLGGHPFGHQPGGGGRWRVDTGKSKVV